MNPDALLRALFAAALEAVDPLRRVPEFLPNPPAGRTVVVGAGKGAAAMAKAVEDNWPAPLEGLVVTRYGHGLPCRRIQVVEAAHPVPDAAGEDAARRILGLVQGLGPDDLVLCLISGGGSALLALPAPGLTLADKQALTQALLRSGAPIGAINCVRKHLSAVKGGRLAAAAAPAAVETLIISDVPGDDPAAIASGPTVADPTTLAEARAVLARYGIAPPAAVAARLADPAAETPKPGDPRLARARATVVARAADALAAAAEAARREGVEAIVLGDALEGEARALATEHAELARARAAAGGGPCLLISGGETIVTLGPEGGGRGGRNLEYLLALGLALEGEAWAAAIACDSDGIDGTEACAGAVLLPGAIARARGLGLDLAAMLAAHDSYAAFAALGALVITGPTRTNVNDFRAVLVAPERG